MDVFGVVRRGFEVVDRSRRCTELQSSIPMKEEARFAVAMWLERWDERMTRSGGLTLEPVGVGVHRCCQSKGRSEKPQMRCSNWRFRPPRAQGS